MIIASEFEYGRLPRVNFLCCFVLFAYYDIHCHSWFLPFNTIKWQKFRVPVNEGLTKREVTLRKKRRKHEHSIRFFPVVCYQLKHVNSLQKFCYPAALVQVASSPKAHSLSRLEQGVIR